MKKPSEQFKSNFDLSESSGSSSNEKKHSTDPEDDSSDGSSNDDSSDSESKYIVRKSHQSTRAGAFPNFQSSGTSRASSNATERPATVAGGSTTKTAAATPRVIVPNTVYDYGTTNKPIDLKFGLKAAKLFNPDATKSVGKNHRPHPTKYVVKHPHEMITSIRGGVFWN